MPNFSIQSGYSAIVEELLIAFAEQLAPLAEGENAVIDEITDSDANLGEKNSILMIVQGPDNIKHDGLRSLLHQVTVHACYLSRDLASPTTSARLKNIAGHGYSLIMADIKLGGVALKCIPTSVVPGFIRYGEYIYVGVLQNWILWKREGFTLP